MRFGMIKDSFKTIFTLFVHITENSVFLKRCLICSEPLSLPEERLICEKCKMEIGKRKLPVCEICSISIRTENNICGQCALKHPPYKKHISFSIYEGKMRKLILLYKLSGIEPLKNYISELYLKAINSGLPKNYDVVIPVPSDPDRKKEFYPVLEIARIVAKEMDLWLSERNLVKVKHTVKQTSLNYNKRLKNLNGAFKLVNEEEIRGKSVLLLDDVHTTGTTIKKCTILLNKVAKEVVVITLARTSGFLRS